MAQTKSIQKEQFSKLYQTGKYTQKELAEQLNITANTISAWVKALPSTAYAKLAATTQAKLQKALEAEKVNHTEVHNLANALTGIERQRDKYRKLGL
ncbi:MAG: hypothetical protein V4543_12330 [Bacteroidota bacterium]